jgi:DNA-binding CsgD family transcriptional regulator/tetratricopeptide (TPR) repeat protein
MREFPHPQADQGRILAAQRYLPQTHLGDRRYEPDNPAMVGRVSSPSLVGRAEDLARLEASLEQAESGRPMTVLVAGEAGIGKSRLVNEFTLRASRGGTSVLRGACVALIQDGLAFAPLVEALRGFLQHLESAELAALIAEDRSLLSRLLPELGQSDQVVPERDKVGDGQTRLFYMLRRLLQRLAEDAPVVLVVEDLHWVDRSTLEFLSYLVSSLRDERLLIVVSYRSDELPGAHPARRWVTEQHRSGRVEELELQRLSRAEVAEQLTGILGEPTSELVDEIFARSEGNPFFAEELVAFSATDGPAELPPRLRDVLLLRVGDCPPGAQAALQVVAVAGRRVDERLLTAVASLPEAELLDGLRAAVDHHLLVVQPHDDSYMFRHALLQEALYGELLPGQRTRLHATLARVLTERHRSGELDWPASAAEIAIHWYRAHDHSNALEWSMKAAAEAEGMHAYPEALRHYRRALELWDRIPDAGRRAGLDRIELLKRAAQAARIGGESRQALTLIELALQEVDPQTEPVRAGLLHERRGEYLMYSGGVDRRFDALAQAIQLIPTDPPSKDRALVLTSLAEALSFAAREEEAAAASQEAIMIARQLGAEPELGRALVVLGWTQAVFGEFEAATASLHEACRLAEQHADPDVLARAYGCLAEVLMQAGHLGDAVAASLSGRERVRQLGLAGYWHETYMVNSAAEALFKLGRWDEADTLARQALTLARPDEMFAFLMVAMLEVGRGQFQAAEAHLQTVKDRALGSWSEFARMYLGIVAELRVWQGRLDEARTTIEQGLDRIVGTDEARSGRLLCLGLRVFADLAERGRISHDPAAVQEAVHAGDELTTRVTTMIPNPLTPGKLPTPATPAVTALWQAERSRLHGQSDPVHWQTAAEAWLALGRPYPAAYAQWRQAEATLYQRVPASRAAEVLRAAYATGLRLGAQPLLDEVTALARRARITLQEPERKAEGSMPSPLEELGLTSRELEVLRHLAAGRSNREIGEALFISAKTASVHISNIFRKLNVVSRVQAAAAAHQLGLVDEDYPQR